MVIFFSTIYIIFGLIVVSAAISLAVPLTPLFSAAGGLIIGKAIADLITEYA